MAYNFTHERDITEIYEDQKLNEALKEAIALFDENIKRASHGKYEWVTIKRFWMKLNTGQGCTMSVIRQWVTF